MDSWLPKILEKTSERNETKGKGSRKTKMSEYVSKDQCLMCGKDNDKGVGFCSAECKEEWFCWPKRNEEEK